ncbi:MAG: hypothetical protein LBD50_00785 [Rickettsiales bacterium]|jgi:hypothetical protein|nr:hypothetical protein [Rickettsiales bacterium]
MMKNPRLFIAAFSIFITSIGNIQAAYDQECKAMLHAITQISLLYTQPLLSWNEETLAALCSDKTRQDCADLCANFPGNLCDFLIRSIPDILDMILAYNSSPSDIAQSLGYCQNVQLYGLNGLYNEAYVPGAITYSASFYIADASSSEGSIYSSVFFCDCEPGYGLTGNFVWTMDDLYSKSCACNVCPDGTYKEYSNYYGSYCAQCPEPGTTQGNQAHYHDSIQKCFIGPGNNFNDSHGTYEFTSNCYY